MRPAAAVSQRAGVDLDLDERRRLEEGADLHERRRRTDIVEQLAVHGQHRGRVAVTKHPGPHDVDNVKPASPSAASMIAKRRAPGLPVAGCCDARPGRRPSCRRPARIADDHGAAVAGRGLPRTPGRDASPAAPICGRAALGHAPAATRGSTDRGRSRRERRPAAWSGARSSQSRYSPASGRCRRWDPARRSSGHPSRPSCWHRTRRRSRRRAARTRAGSERLAWSTSRPERPAAPSASGDHHLDRRRTSGHRRGRAWPGSPPRPPPGRADGGTQVDLECRSVPRRRSGRVPPSMTPDVDVTPGQRPLSACSARLVGRLEDRAAALLGLHAGVRRAAWTLIPGRAMPLRGDDVAVGPGAFQDQARSTTARDRRMTGSTRAIRSPRPGSPRTGPASNGSRRRLAQDAQRIEARQQPALHVRHTRAVAMPLLHLEGPLGHGAQVEHRVHVADHSSAGPAGGRPPRCPRAYRRAQVVGCTGHPAPRSRSRGDPSADLVHAGLGVRAAVDIDEPLEIREVGRPRPLDGGPERLELGRGNGGIGRGGHVRNLPDEASRRTLSRIGGSTRPIPCEASHPGATPHGGIQMDIDLVVARPTW